MVQGYQLTRRITGYNGVYIDWKIKKCWARGNCRESYFVQFSIIGSNACFAVLARSNWLQLGRFQMRCPDDSGGTTSPTVRRHLYYPLWSELRGLLPRVHPEPSVLRTSWTADRTAGWVPLALSILADSIIGGNALSWFPCWVDESFVRLPFLSAVEIVNVRSVSEN